MLVGVPVDARLLLEDFGVLVAVTTTGKQCGSSESNGKTREYVGNVAGHLYRGGRIVGRAGEKCVTRQGRRLKQDRRMGFVLGVEQLMRRRDAGFAGNALIRLRRKCGRR